MSDVTTIDAAGNVALKATAAATYGGSGAAVLFGLTANEVAAYGGLLVAIIAGIANVLINWYWRRRHYRLAEQEVIERRQQDLPVVHDRRRQGGKARVAAMAVTLALSSAGVGFLAGHEGLRTVAYLDPVGIPTICYGSTEGVQLGQRATFDECNAMLKRDATYAGQSVARCTHVAVTQEQYDALVSFAYNVGGGAYCSSTLASKLNAGDCWGAGAQFDRWIYAKGRKLPGLVRRRAEERTMFETGCQRGTA